MKKIIALLLLFLFLPISAFAELTVYFLDVGQGDAALVRCDGEAIYSEQEYHIIPLPFMLQC